MIEQTTTVEDLEKHKKDLITLVTESKAAKHIYLEKMQKNPAVIKKNEMALELLNRYWASRLTFIAFMEEVIKRKDEDPFLPHVQDVLKDNLTEELGSGNDKHAHSELWHRLLLAVGFTKEKIASFKSALKTMKENTALFEEEIAALSFISETTQTSTTLTEEQIAVHALTLESKQHSTSINVPFIAVVSSLEVLEHSEAFVSIASDPESQMPLILSTFWAYEEFVSIEYGAFLEGCRNIFPDITNTQLAQLISHVHHDPRHANEIWDVLKLYCTSKENKLLSKLGVQIAMAFKDDYMSGRYESMRLNRLASSL